jgi:hypothetical protein
MTRSQCWCPTGSIFGGGRARKTDRGPAGGEGRRSSAARGDARTWPLRSVPTSPVAHRPTGPGSVGRSTGTKEANSHSGSPGPYLSTRPRGPLPRPAHRSSDPSQLGGDDRRDQLVQALWLTDRPTGPSLCGGRDRAEIREYISINKYIHMVIDTFLYPYRPGPVRRQATHFFPPNRRAIPTTWYDPVDAPPLSMNRSTGSDARSSVVD